MIILGVGTGSSQQSNFRRFRRYDEPSELAEGLKIKAVPQFDFYMGSQLVERFATREKARIADAINKHAGEGTVVLSEIDRSLGQPAKP